MKTFRIQIRAYGYYADFELASEDDDKAFENALVDKLGQNDIIWERTGMFAQINRITYEEVTYDTRPIQSKKVLGVEVGTGASG